MVPSGWYDGSCFQSAPKAQKNKQSKAQEAQKAGSGGSVVGCPLNRREKARPLLEGHYRVPSLYPKRSGQAWRPGPPPKPLSN